MAFLETWEAALGSRVHEERDSKGACVADMQTKQASRASKPVWQLAGTAGAPALHGTIHFKALAESATWNVQQQPFKHTAP